MKVLTAVGLLLIGACSQPLPPPPAPEPAAERPPERLPERLPEPRPAPPQAAFAGTWRVTTIDGVAAAPVDRSPILVTLDSGAVVASADCAFMGELRYTVTGATLGLIRPPPAVVGSCARGLSPFETAFTRVYQAGAVASLRGETLLIEHGGRSAVLVRRPVAPVRLALLPPSPAGDAATISGMLEADGPCLYVRTPYRDRFLPAFLTPDTRWDAATGVLHVGDKRFTHGSRVRLGGSFMTRRGPLPWRQAPDPSCQAPRTWIAAAVDPDTSPRSFVYTGEDLDRMRAEDARK